MNENKAIEEVRAKGFTDIQVVDFDKEESEFAEHTHDVHTIHYILAGELIVKDGEDVIAYLPGDVVEFPAGTTHSTKGTTKGCKMVVGFKYEDGTTEDIPLPKSSRPATSALEGIGVTALNQLVDYTEQEIADLHGMGPKALGILKEHLTEHGLSFKQA
jgi:quercetin dioxygenase-like cupin family protein